MARRAVRGLRNIEVADQATVERYMQDRERTLNGFARHGPLYMLYGSDAYTTSVRRDGYVGSDLAAGRSVVIVPRVGAPVPEILPAGVSVISGTADTFSSSKIKQQIAAGARPDGLPRRVERYIERHRLYGRGRL